MSLQPKPQLQFADWLAAERASDQGRTEFLNAQAPQGRDIPAQGNALGMRYNRPQP